MRSSGSRRAARSLVVATMVTAATLAVSPGTAHGCSCVERGLAEYADEISVAFVGTQLERVVRDPLHDDGAVLLFSVDRVYAGEVGPLMEVRTHAQESACGIDVGHRGLVGIAAHHRRGALSVNLCGSVVAQVELESVFGEGRPPDESVTLTMSPDPAEDVRTEGDFDTGVSSDEDALAEPAAGSTDGDQGLLAIVVAAGVAAVAVAAGAVIVSRRVLSRRR